MSRIESMMAETNSEMAAESSGESEAKSSSLGNKVGSNRIHSLMEMDYDTEDDSEAQDPEETGFEKKAAPPASSAKKEESDPEEKDTPEKKVEEKEPVDDKEEEEKEPVVDNGKKKIKYKVDGQEVEEEVSEQDLINSYSGQKALQKRFSELDKTRKEFEKEKNQVVESQKYVLDEVGNVQKGFQEVVKDFSELGYSRKDPLDTVYNLLDKMNVDPASYQKALFFHMIPEVSKFLDMSDEGRDAYLLKMENEWFHKKQSKLAESQQANAAERKRLESENSVKQQYGVSEERFSELRDELINEHGVDPRNLKFEQVIGWHLEKPAYDRASALVDKTGGNKNQKLQVAKLLLTYPNTTDDEILTALGYKDKQAKDIGEQLKNKTPPMQKKQTVDRFDKQIDEDFNKRFRRR